MQDITLVINVCLQRSKMGCGLDTLQQTNTRTKQNRVSSIKLKIKVININTKAFKHIKSIRTGKAQSYTDKADL